MTRSEFVALLSALFTDRQQHEVDAAVHTIFQHLAQELGKGKRVELRGLGSFGTRQHTAHVGRNPRTGEAVKVGEKYVPYFRAGKELKERVNRRNHGMNQHCVSELPSLSEPH
ncbi:integration host factor subunit beta [Saccharibacter sp. 17.LH.SD]|uniref:HU family DNA-binding protein n=1 Tax=Saccharibacter sp. 17.LH.SD TaxID=2689393 RepID=UPI00136EC5F3|nr:HU family DNA-binding protein [Saccharibacter sp. 17.LH.SD]MXV44637.1 integration host factor subunit beta [Saccharibacter sp. 17.LH.SD]